MSVVLITVVLDGYSSCPVFSQCDYLIIGQDSAIPFFRRIVGKFSVNVPEYFRFFHVINYLLTGLLVPYREILSPRFLRKDLASSVRTSKPRA